MHKLRTLALAATLILAAPAQAQFLDFEDLQPPSQVPVPDGYMGFEWDNFYSQSRADAPDPSGYLNMDGDWGIFNAFGNPAAVSRASSFHFESALIGAAWRDGLLVNVRGLLNGVELFNTALLVGTASGQHFVFGWSGINQLQFEASGGMSPGITPFDGTHFIMDNMLFGPQQVVPEPISMVLLGTGLAGIAAARRRREGGQA
jgi:hypothetical protein